MGHIFAGSMRPGHQWLSTKLLCLTMNLSADKVVYELE
jgi:hypothetical protein